MVIAFAIVFSKLWEYKNDISISWSANMFIQLILSVIAYAIVVFASPVIYQKLLFITTKKNITFKKVVNVYCKSNIMKYLPGNVMQYVGRNQLAVDENLSHIKVVLATVLEMLLTVLTAVVLAILFARDYSFEWIENNTNLDIEYLWLMIPIVLAFGLILYLLREKIPKYIIELISVENMVLYVGLIVYNCIIISSHSLIYFWVLSALGIKLNSEIVLVGIGLYALSFFLGYITPGVPGGIGIREAVLVYFFASLMGEAQVLSGALVFRIISIIGDLLAWLLSLGYNRLVQRRNKNE